MIALRYRLLDVSIPPRATRPDQFRVLVLILTIASRHRICNLTLARAFRGLAPKIDDGIEPPREDTAKKMQFSANFWWVEA